MAHMCLCLHGCTYHSAGPVFFLEKEKQIRTLCAWDMISAYLRTGASMVILDLHSSGWTAGAGNLRDMSMGQEYSLGCLQARWPFFPMRTWFSFPDVYILFMDSSMRTFFPMIDLLDVIWSLRWVRDLASYMFKLDYFHISCKRKNRLF